VSALLVLTIGSALLYVTQPVTDANRKGLVGVIIGLKVIHFASVWEEVEVRLIQCYVS
jgi:hypothetical protein